MRSALFLMFTLGLCEIAQGTESFELPARWIISLPENPTASELFAKSELEKYLASLPGDGPDGNFAIRVSGRGAELPAGEAPDGRLGEDVYRVRITPSGADLLGVNDRGALYAVYDFLESFGYRWLMPGTLGEVPANSRLLAPTDRVERPAFFIRELCTSAGESWTPEEMVDWEVKNRLNRDFNLRRLPAWESRGGSPLWHWIAHNYKFILPPESDYFKTHPEWFALYKGKRVPLGNEQGNVCTTNPGLISHFVQFIRNWFDNHPDGSVFPLSPPDGAIRWCEDEACLALGGRNFTPGPEGSMSLRQIRFVKAIADEVGKTHPDRRILLLAYQNYVDPVPGEKLPANVLVQVVNYGAFGQPMTSPVNKRQMERFQGWADITERGTGSPGVWDYCLLQVDNLSGSRLTPIPVARALQENLRFIHSLGGRIFFTQAGPLQESNPFVFYAAAQWAWNPETPFDDLLRDFCNAFYGPAAVPMRDYWLLLENAARDVQWNPGVWPGITVPDPRLFSPDVLQTADKLLEAAEQAAATSPYNARVALIRRSLDYVSTAAGQTKPWRVVRGPDRYFINADGGHEAAKQVKGLEAELKNSADPDGSLHRLIFRLRPREARVEILRNETALVAVVPELGGRIVRFVDPVSGWNFLDEPEGDLTLENPGAAYVHYGGYEEYGGAAFAAPGWEIPFRFGREDDSLKLAGRFGDLEFSRRVSLAADAPVLRIESEMKSPASDPILRGHPVLRLPDPLGEIVLVWKDSGGVWRQQSLVEGTPADIAGAWGVYSPKLQVLLLHRFEEDSARAHLHLDPEKNTFNLELASVSGGPARLVQEFELRRGTLEDVLRQPVSDL